TARRRRSQETRSSRSPCGRASSDPGKPRSIPEVVTMSSPRVRAPIVLVHGLLGCDRLRLLGWPIVDSFHHIPPAPASPGNRLLPPALTPTAAVADRAVELKSFLDAQAPGEAVHLFAYSMGGLDARSMISHLGMADRVLTLTTLGTSHR